MRSKERNTENAVIAAAALTAAVDNPLPLKTVEQKPVLVKERAQVVPVSVVPAVSKSEEDQLTEPEEETRRRKWWRQKWCQRRTNACVCSDADRYEPLTNQARGGF